MHSLGLKYELGLSCFFFANNYLKPCAQQTIVKTVNDEDNVRDHTHTTTNNGRFHSFVFVASDRFCSPTATQLA